MAHMDWRLRIQAFGCCFFFWLEDMFHKSGPSPRSVWLRSKPLFAESFLG